MTDLIRASLGKYLRHSGAATRPASGDLLRPEPGIHGVRRLGADLTPWIPAFAGMTMLGYWASSPRCGLNPMDPRSPIKAFEDKLRGDDGGALKRLRKRHAGLARMALA